MEQVDKICPSCGGRMVLKEWNGFFEWKDPKSGGRRPWKLKGFECTDCGRFIDV